MNTKARKAGPNPDDARAIFDAVRHIVRALRLSARDSEQHVGLSSAQLFVLNQLRDGKGLALIDLAARTFTDSSSVSVVVSKLVEKGLVARVRAVNDGRRVTITLTAAGRQVLRTGPDPAQNRFVAAIAALPPRKRAELAGLLDTVVSHMGLGGRAGLFFEDETSVPARKGRHVGA